ncbi:MAG: hypothetical protein WCF12_11840 [Propionicimonas sp.]
MSDTWPPQEPENQWKQPPFAPPPEETPAPEVSGTVLVPVDAAQLRPTPLETALRVLARWVWPLAIIATFTSRGSLWEMLIGAIVVSAVLNQVTREMKRRRLAGVRQAPSIPPQDLR